MTKWSYQFLTKQSNKETWSIANIPRDSDQEKAFLVMLALSGHNIDVTPKSETHYREQNSYAPMSHQQVQ